MSETVHYKGILTEVKSRHSKTLQEIAKNILNDRGVEISEYHLTYNKDDFIAILCDELYEEYHYHIESKRLFNLTKDGCDPDGDIIRASNRVDGRIDYELRYYNGGAGFGECLDEALNKM